MVLLGATFKGQKTNKCSTLNVDRDWRFVKSSIQRDGFLLYPLHLEHPDWLPIYDVLPEKAAASKRRILDYAADEQARVMEQHFPPFPSLGHIIKQGEGWQWQPIEIDE